MENIQLNNPNSRLQSPSQDTVKPSVPVSLHPQFDDLNNPDVFTEHIGDLTQQQSIPHDRILETLLEQTEPLDFESLANPKNRENFKLKERHYLIEVVRNVISLAEKNGCGLGKRRDIIYSFNGVYWREIERELFQNFLNKAADSTGVPTDIAEFFRFRKQLLEQFLEGPYIEDPAPKMGRALINLKNGTLEVSLNGPNLRPFHRLDFLTYQLPFEYDPTATAPVFDTYINRVLPDNNSRLVLAEYLGYVFIKNGSGSLKEEKALILYGTGANGKSVFFEIVNALFGRENISHFSLEDLTNKTGYHRAQIANKLVNYGSEINGKLESSIFKQLASGEPVEARLPYGKPQSLSQYAKLIFNCNELPKDVEQNLGYFRRFIIIPFEVTIPEAEQDKQLHTKIIDNELSGVLNWALEGLDRLLTQKGFSQCDAADHALEQYKMESDSVKSFLDENGYQSNPTKSILIKDLYIGYQSFCTASGYWPVSKVNFKKRLKASGVVTTKLNVGNVAYLSR